MTQFHGVSTSQRSDQISTEATIYSRTLGIWVMMAMMIAMMMVMMMAMMMAMMMVITGGNLSWEAVTEEQKPLVDTVEADWGRRTNFQPSP